ncbi:hypothetical protein GCM10023321_50300 [Pseudonocardia eucalypti]|uniref:Uncharacterized protein n=1 Tax=Pseudonocardia eucalypti TaxID=648755 RepID=A0ABP9QKB2_9PSEU
MSSSGNATISAGNPIRCFSHRFIQPSTFAGPRASIVEVTTSIEASKTAKNALIRNAKPSGSAANIAGTWITRCANQLTGVSTATAVLAHGGSFFATRFATVAEPRTANPTKLVTDGHRAATSTAPTPDTAAITWVGGGRTRSRNQATTAAPTTTVVVTTAQPGNPIEAAARLPASPNSRDSTNQEPLSTRPVRRCGRSVDLLIGPRDPVRRGQVLLVRLA